MAGLVIDDGIKESDYGYVLRVSGPCECLCCSLSTARAGHNGRPSGGRVGTRRVRWGQGAFPKLC